LVKVEVTLTFDDCDVPMWNQLKITAQFTSNFKENIVHLLDLAQDLERAIRLSKIVKADTKHEAV